MLPLSSAARARRLSRRAVLSATLAAGALGLGGLAACADDGPAAATAPAPSPGTVTPDLRFAPAVLQVAPGDTARTTVRVTTGADLRGATFALAGAPAGVAVAFEAAADGASGTLLVTAAPGAALGSATLTVHGTGASGKAWVGQLALAAAGHVGRSYFVAPTTGSDANAGTAATPYKTLAKALGQAVGGDTVRLAVGGYGAAFNGDTFTDATHTVTVRAGVTVIGGLDSGAPGSTLLGTGTDVGLQLEGGAKIRNVQLVSFGIGVLARQGTQSLTNVLVVTGQGAAGAPVSVDGQVFQLAGGLVLLGTAHTTLTGGQLVLADVANGAGVFQQAHFAMSGGKVTTVGPNCRNATGIRAEQSARVATTDVFFTDVTGPAVRATQQSAATVRGGLIQRHLPAGCTPSPGILAEGSAAVTTRNVEMSQLAVSQQFALVGSGIATISDGPLTVEATTINGFGAGIDVRAGTGTATITNSFVNGCNVCIDVRAAKSRVVVRQTFATSGIAGSVGIFTPVSAPFVLRGSTIHSNSTGVLVRGPGADLGTASDPGGNTITNNVLTGVKVDGGVPRVDVRARGNTWVANAQGADGAGHYAPGAVVDGLNANAKGDNFDLRQFNANAAVRILF